LFSGIEDAMLKMEPINPVLLVEKVAHKEGDNSSPTSAMFLRLL
jgi:hypothetical protein